MFEIFLVIIGLLYISYWIKSKEYRKMIDHFPGPKKWPIFGNVLEWSFELDVMFTILRNYAKKYKMTYRLWDTYNGTVNVITPEDVQTVLLCTTETKKCFIYKFFHPWLGSGLFTSDGNKWHQRRKILTPAFHFTILRRFVDIFNKHSNMLVEKLKEECRKPKTKIIPLMNQCTFNIICETAMGTNINSNETKEKKYMQTIHGTTNIILQRFMNPLLHNKYIFNCAPMGWRQRKNVKILHAFTEHVIKNRQETFQKEYLHDLEHIDDGVTRKTRLAMLDLLIDAKNNKGIIDDMGIRDEVDTFMFAGHDTMTAALCFSLVTLANHNDVQDKIFEELRKIFKTSNRQPTYNDLQNMKYLEMCLKECLRLYPSAPLISRELTKDLLLSGGPVPSGCVVNIHIYDLHRNPNVFPYPEKFDPDRFLPENIRGRHPFSYIPFSAGLRNCIGQKFAILELKTVVSSILRNFTLEAVTTRQDLKFILDVLLRTKDAIYVKFTERISKI